MKMITENKNKMVYENKMENKNKIGNENNNEKGNKNKNKNENKTENGNKNESKMLISLVSGYKYFLGCLTVEIFPIGIFSYFGVYIRVTIINKIISQEMNLNNNYSDPYHISLLSPLFSNNHFIPNLIGCYIISILYHNKNNITKKCGNALYVGMCAGLCGCLTTFSSWIYESAEDMFVINVLTTIIIMVNKILILICVIVVLILIHTFIS